MISWRLRENFDWLTFVVMLLLAGWGVLTIYSATSGKPDSPLHQLYTKQLTWLAYGFVGFLIALLVDYHYVGKHAYVIYGIAVLSLLAVLTISPPVQGAQRWLGFGGFRVQPSEFAKIALILALAHYFAESQKLTPRGLLDLLRPALLTLVPFLLIVKQPDLGTALMILVIFAGLVLCVGIQRRTFLLLCGLVLAALPLLWLVMQDYQRSRVLTLLNPGSDPRGAGYHSMQSLIAIGSGGVWGKGMFQGTQSRLDFLPEKHTDFIFAVVSEELGFFGGTVLILLYLTLIGRGVTTALKARDRLGALLALGMVVLFSVTTAANIGMTIGVAPVVGIPLPFMSYGGSSLVSMMFAFGLLLNVRLRRYSF